MQYLGQSYHVVLALAEFEVMTPRLAQSGQNSSGLQHLESAWEKSERVKSHTIAQSRSLAGIHNLFVDCLNGRHCRERRIEVRNSSHDRSPNKGAVVVVRRLNERVSHLCFEVHDSSARKIRPFLCTCQQTFGWAMKHLVERGGQG